MMRHEPDNPGVAAFTSNCTSAGQLLRNQGGIEPLASPSAPEAVPLPIRQWPLALWAWLVLTRFTFKGLDGAMMSLGA